MIDKIQTALKDFEAYAVKNLDCSANGSSTPFTEGIMTRLCDIGQDAGYYVYVKSISQADGGEWLYDMTWLVYDRKRLTDIGLALECEWDYFPGVLDDFQKLLLVRADLRCLIFWSKTLQSTRENIRMLIDEVVGCRKSEHGDDYLFCVWVDEQMGFMFHPYTHESAT